MSFPRYSSYKPAGVEWLGDVPAHWEIKKVSHVADLIAGFAFPSDEFSFDPEFGIPLVRGDNVTEGWLRWGEKGRYWPTGRGYDARYLLKADDIVIQMDGSKVGKNWALVKEDDLPALLVQRVTRVRVCGPVPKFVYALFAHEFFLRYVDRAKTDPAIPHITMKNIGDYWIPNPPFAEQTRIAEFLDRETAKIDGLVAEQQRLTELLKEKRQAVISHAVTRGLNPKAPLKPSGIEWLGDVPKHWEVTRLANVFREVAEAGSDELPILSVSIHHGVSDEEMSEEDMDRKVRRSDDRSKYKRVEAGDLAYNMMRAWQGGFGAVTVTGMISPAYVVARPKRPLETAFFEKLLRTPKAIEQMRRHSQGVTDFRLRLYWDEFKNIRVALPPIEEQRAIYAKIAAMEKEFDTLTAEAHRAIDLLQERRTALISAAVTGQIDVRGLAAAPVETFRHAAEAALYET